MGQLVTSTPVSIRLIGLDHPQVRKRWSSLRVGPSKPTATARSTAKLTPSTTRRVPNGDQPKHFKMGIVCPP
jgi:hypothetical protein